GQAACALSSHAASAGCGDLARSLSEQLKGLPSRRGRCASGRLLPRLVLRPRNIVFYEVAENDRDVTPLEERIGYKFRNPLLLAEALTHPSLGHEAQRYHFDYQRLEFLGDAVLQLVITEYLFRNFRVEAEGQLTKLRSRLVSREALKMHRSEEH